jgi:inhibitor of KinA sporulation pathway (predicted exonuclease)
MVYVIMDLEWNSVYGYKIRSFLNEIIEIGAVMLDEEFREVDSFSMLVRSQLGARLRLHVTELTNISPQELEQGGLPFTKAAARFREWLGRREHVLLTWGDGDIRVLLANERYHTGTRSLSYIQNYMDLQLYFQHRFHTSPAQQVGLVAASERLGLNSGNYAFHRALDDSRATAEILRQIYQEEDFDAFVRPCNTGFYAELEYKPRFISDINSPLVDRSKLYYLCRNCGREARQLSDWRFASRGFQALFHCDCCDQYAKATVGFKKLYASVEVKRSARVLPEPPEIRK